MKVDDEYMKLGETECWKVVLEFFKSDSVKTGLWFHTPNPLLGWQEPYMMIALGREKDLLNCLKDWIGR